jgi:chromosomal replication initiation ATPase DnaA
MRLRRIHNNCGRVLNLIWQQCISCLEGEISEQQLNTWILPLQVEQELNTLKLLAPNRFVMDWVRKHFLERIRELVTSLDDSKSISVSLAAHRRGEPIVPQGSMSRKDSKTLSRASQISWHAPHRYKLAVIPVPNTTHFIFMVEWDWVKPT